jgi:hypothetical protein
VTQLLSRVTYSACDVPVTCPSKPFDRPFEPRVKGRIFHTCGLADDGRI